MLFDYIFNAEKISFNNLDDLQQSAPNLIIYAAPVMFFFVVVEYIISRIQHHELYEKKEAIGSILVGLGNIAIGFFLKTLLFYGFILVYNLVPWRMHLDWWTFLPCYIVFDFC
ncbi:MAG TPA: hypothetical protein VGD31_06565, partial [Sphingobacteriaceae bacterium]